ncbi:MAG: MaoC family dehydratase [Desulfomonile tiedjei]|nr:MaoC family dehydratase [Desulfomonile tiedjei]
MEIKTDGSTGCKPTAEAPSPGAAPTDRYFEDYVAGEVLEFGCVTLDEADMIAFARRFDPQPFHTDPAAAKKSVYGGLIASGWYTASQAMRLLVDHFVSREASLGSPGVDELRWLKPVRPGDTLSLRVTVLDAQRSQSKPDQGSIRVFAEARNQHGEVVMTMKSVGFIRCREQLGPSKE